jgi:acetylornithine deacetylase/succinyl-diaminopimelate desuccinylase-like protein
MIDAAVRERSDALVKTLLDSVRIASVSLTGEGIQDQVGFLKKRLEGWGFAVEVHPTTSHPIVYAEIGPRDAKFTWLLYGHYDVYPADEKQEGWRTRPFEPVVEGDRVWGRGTGDNKGQHLAMLNAIALYRELHGELPIRVKVILEGDEETGSVPLPKFIEANRARLKADLCCYSDGPMFPNDQPVLLMGVRGNLGLEFVAKGAKRNLHSGNFGGVAPNPTLDLIHLLAEMVDRDGKLLVPGAGYADVTVTPADLEAVRTLKVDHKDFKQSVGVEPATGKGRCALPRTFDVAPGVQRLRFRVRLHRPGPEDDHLQGSARQGRRAIGRWPGSAEGLRSDRQVRRRSWLREHRDPQPEGDTRLAHAARPPDRSQDKSGGREGFRQEGARGSVARRHHARLSSSRDCWDCRRS